MVNVFSEKKETKTETLPETEASELEITYGSHKWFWFMLALFCGLIFVRNVVGMEYPIVILLACFCAIALFCNHDEMMALAITCIPFSAAFQYRYALLALIIVYLIKFPKSIKHINAFLPLALMMTWELFHGLLPYNFSFVNYLQGFAELIFLSFVMSLGNKKFDIVLITRALAICTLFAGCIGVLKLLAETGYNFEAIFDDGYRLGINEEDAGSYVMNFNANALGFICNMSICGVLVMGKARKLVAFDVFMIIALAFLGFLTISRSFIICLVFVSVAYFAASAKNLEKLLKSLITVILLVAVVLFLVNNIAPFIFDNLIARFGEDDISNGRNELFSEYWDFTIASLGNLFFGIGMQGVMTKVWAQGFEHIDNVPHNGLQELVVVWGIMGLILFLSLLFTVISSSRKINRKHTLMNWLPLLLLLLMIQSGQLITAGSRFVVMLYIYIVFCTQISEDYKNEIQQHI